MDTKLYIKPTSARSLGIVAKGNIPPRTYILDEPWLTKVENLQLDSIIEIYMALACRQNSRFMDLH
jgi:hypothetical protein